MAALVSLHISVCHSDELLGGKHPFVGSRSYCPDHRPAQTLSVSSELSLPQTCSICLDVIEPILGYAILKCPSCHGSWFHRDCVQVQNRT